jgi:ketosteroid isomerase-like protein
MAHPNEELIRSGYQAFAQGDVEAVLAQFDENITWHVGGRSAIAGDYHGHQGVMEFFGKLLEMTGGTFRLDIHDVLASDEHAVALVTSSAERNGASWTSDSAHVWHVHDGKATEFWGLSTNPYGDDEFWS